MGRSISLIPRAIAPEVTSTSSSPSAWRRAVSSQTPSRTSRRTSPAGSATMLDPSLTTTVAMRGRVWGLAAGPARQPPVAVHLGQPERLRLGLVLGLEDRLDGRLV